MLLAQHQVQDVQSSLDTLIRENANFGFDAGDVVGERAIEDVHSVADFYSWMRLGFLPVILADSYAYSEGVSGGAAVEGGGGIIVGIGGGRVVESLQFVSIRKGLLAMIRIMSQDPCRCQHVPVHLQHPHYIFVYPR